MSDSQFLSDVRRMLWWLRLKQRVEDVRFVEAFLINGTDDDSDEWMRNHVLSLLEQWRNCTKQTSFISSVVAQSEHNCFEQKIYAQVCAERDELKELVDKLRVQLKRITSDEKPPGFIAIRVHTDDDGTLSFPTKGFTTIRACRHCGVLIAGGPTTCTSCVNGNRLTNNCESDDDDAFTP